MVTFYEYIMALNHISTSLSSSYFLNVLCEHNLKIVDNLSIVVLSASFAVCLYIFT